MVSPVKNPSEIPASPELGSDPELVGALFAVFRELDLAEQLQALLDPAIRWSGATCGFGLGAGTERRAFVPLVASVPDQDPRFGAFSGIDPERLKVWLPDGLTVFDRLGPFAATTRWPGEQPAKLLALPVVSTRERWAGAILLTLERPPEPAVLDRLGSLLEMARPAVDNALQVQSMRELVIKDDTAACFNRRHFEEFLPEELSRASRFRSPVSLIFLDMDNLKQVNSLHGHTMGSRVLYEVSTRIRSKIRKFDKLFRFGGDEFCIVLPETEWHGALEVAERVRDVISGKPFLVRELGREGVKMTASLGLASFPLHAQSQQDMIQQADLAMRKIKGAGKNAIGIAEIAGGDDEL